MKKRTINKPSTTATASNMAAAREVVDMSSTIGEVYKLADLALNKRALFEADVQRIVGSAAS